MSPSPNLCGRKDLVDEEIALLAGSGCPACRRDDDVVCHGTMKFNRSWAARFLCCGCGYAWGETLLGKTPAFWREED